MHRGFNPTGMFAVCFLLKTCVEVSLKRGRNGRGFRGAERTCADGGLATARRLL